MAGENPNREVSLDFTIKGDAEQKAGGLGKALDRVHYAADQASAKVVGFGRNMAVGALGAMGLTYGLRGVWDHAKDVNLSMETMQKRIAGATFAFSTWKAGTSGLDKWRESMRDGVAITEKLGAVSRRHKIYRDELASIYESQSMMSERYRQTQVQQIALTERLAATQNVLGVSAEAAGEMIGRAAMTGAIPLRSSLGRELAAGVGNLKAFKKASEEVRFEKLKKALGDMVPASREMGTGMKGALFDIREAATNLTRDLSAPLFAAQTKSLRDWAASITRVREDGKSIAHEYGEKIAKAFTVIKDVSGSIAEHWKLIAGLVVANKLGGMVSGAARTFGGPGAGAAGGVAGMLGGTVAGMTIQAANVVVNSGGLGAALGGATSDSINKSLRPGFADLAKGVAGCASKMFIAAEVAGGLAIAISGAIDSMQTAALQVQRTAPVQGMTAMTAALKTMTAKTAQEGIGHLRTVAESLNLKAGQRVAGTTIAASLREMDAAQRMHFANKFGIKGDMASATASGFAEEAGRRIADKINEMLDLARKNYGQALGDEKSDKAKATRAPVTNIGTVNITQDFKEAEPERVFHRVLSEINQVVHMPSVSLVGLPVSH